MTGSFFHMMQSVIALNCLSYFCISAIWFLPTSAAYHKNSESSQVFANVVKRDEDSIDVPVTNCYSNGHKEFSLQDNCADPKRRLCKCADKNTARCTLKCWQLDLHRSPVLLTPGARATQNV